MVNSQNHEDDQIGFSEDSDTYAAQAALAEPLPEMSVQDAESVLGMSPMPYMATQEGPSTPSAGVPSPNPFPSAHYQQQHGPGTTPTVHAPMTPGSVGTPTGPTGGRGSGGGGGGGGGGSQEYGGGSMEVNEMGGASTPGMSSGGGAPNASITPPAYPPPYPAAMDMSGYHPSTYSPGNYPPYNNSSFHRQYDVPPDFPPGMSSSMMRLPFPSGRGPYSAGMPPHRTPMDYHGHAYHPHMMQGGMRDPSMYPGGGMHGMAGPDWHWQQQQQQLQQQQHIQRLRQQQAVNAMRQQQAAMAAMQQSSNRNTPSLPPSHSAVGGGGPPSMDPGGGKGPGSAVGSQWQDQNHPHKGMMVSKVGERLLSSSSSSSSPKPMPKHHEPTPMDKAKMHHHHHHHEPSVAAQSTAEAHKRSHPDWSNCVEGTKPMLVKRRKLYGFNCGECCLVAMALPDLGWMGGVVWVEWL